MEELQEARRRRSLLIQALQDAFPDGRSYINGSVAHGDANTPLTDVDLGVVVDVEGYGPDDRGAISLMEQAGDAIREHLKDDYDNLVVTVQGQKQAVLVRFGDPVTPGQTDFTADVIVALDHPSGEGLWILDARDLDLTLPVRLHRLQLLRVAVLLAVVVDRHRRDVRGR
jgi:hypothetical protein